VSEQQERHDQPAAGGAPAATQQLEAEVARLEDRFKRAAADLDNYRKRTTKEIERRTTETSDALLGDWLEVADSVERALTTAGDGPVDEGLRAVRDQIESTLARQRVTRIGQVGEPFDPDRHEAVAVRGSDELPDRAVAEVIRSGYARDGRVLRPALVAVSRRPSADEAPDAPPG
jgi:molecular chaperone GrpE